MGELKADVCKYVQTQLAVNANPEKAAGMFAYMYGKRYQSMYDGKNVFPFYGTQRPVLTPIIRQVLKEFPPADRTEYEELVLALWALPHREEKYIAQRVAVGHRQYVTPESLPLYRRFIVEGAWWDFVDEAATHMVRTLVLEHPVETWPAVDTWIDHGDMWLRRSAIICQVGAKENTDVDRLFDFCERRTHEKEFFIRKAIGWALREYSKTDPDAVALFVIQHRDDFSGLSYREATKHIKDLVEG